MRTGAVEFVARYLRTVWEADDKSAVIAIVLDDGGEERTVKGPGDSGPRFQTGLSYRFHGTWGRHAKHGQQFAFATYAAVLPHDRRGVIAYLTTIAEGIGEKRAEKLWDAFGAGAVQVLRAQPERVVAAGIASAEIAAEASQSLHDEAAFEGVKIDLLGLFAGRGFQAGKLIKECLARWGARAPERIRRNPYLLMLEKLPSAGFKRCDRLYLDLGLPRNRLKRQALFVWHMLRGDSSGHTWFAAKPVASALAEAIAGAAPLAALKLAVKSRLLTECRDADDPHATSLAEYRKVPGEPTGARFLTQRLSGVWLAERQKAHDEAIVADKVREMLAADTEVSPLDSRSALAQR